MKKIFSFLMVALFSASMSAQEVQHTYTVVGESAALFGTAWAPTLATNDMSLVEGVYTIKFEDKVLPAGNIEYKIVQDHAWAVAYPQDGNTSFNIPEDGQYDVTFTLDLSQNPAVYNAVAEKKGDAVIEKHYLVAAQKEIANGKHWDNNADINLMTTADEGVTYTLTIENVTMTAGTEYSYQIVEKGTWNKYFDNGKVSVAETAIYTINYVFTVATSTCVVETTKTGDTEVVIAYYLVGSMNNWTPAEAYMFAENPAQEGEFSLTVTLGLNEQLKVVKTENGAVATWYPDGEGNDYTVDATHAGESKTIYFRPAGNTEWESFHEGGFFYIEPNEITAIDNTAIEAKAVKSLENGMLIIIKNGARYNVLGTIVR